MRSSGCVSCCCGDDTTLRGGLARMSGEDTPRSAARRVSTSSWPKLQQQLMTVSCSSVVSSRHFTTLVRQRHTRPHQELVIYSVLTLPLINNIAQCCMHGSDCYVVGRSSGCVSCCCGDDSTRSVASWRRCLGEAVGVSAAAVATTRHNQSRRGGGGLAKQ